MYNNNLLGSKKCKAALVGALSAGITEFVIVFGAGMGIDIPQELVLMILAPFLTYIGAKGAADIAYNAKNGKTVETPSLDKNLIGGFETPLKPAYEPPQDYDYAGRMSDAKTEYQKALWADYTLIDFNNPTQVERDFLAKWESSPILNLYEKAKAGLVIVGSAKKEIIALMQDSVKAEGLRSIITILSILEILCNYEEMYPISSNKSLYQSNKEETDRLNKVINYTMKNYKNEITLEEISSIAHLSNTSFCRYFKMMTKKTFHDFLIEIRINHAQRILIEDMSVTTEAACFDCGFNNRSNFFRHFKKKTGFTPREYKRKYASKNIFV